MPTYINQKHTQNLNFPSDQYKRGIQRSLKGEKLFTT